MSTFLPARLDRIGVPPIKCQGIKTRLAAFIAQSLVWEGRGRWIEPFLGSGSVLFNIAPRKAIAADSNIHIIRFYRDLQSGALNETLVRDYLEEAGRMLRDTEGSYYYRVREEFNRVGGGSLEFLFLSRACFNGVLRFNGRGEYNVPFNHKPARFSRAYITKIVNQVAWVRGLLLDRDWSLAASGWEDTLSAARAEDFVYLDPPYIGRHADYFSKWSEEDALRLARTAETLPCGFALSMWKENQYRSNDHLRDHWKGLVTRTFRHYYHVGPKESLRHEMTEALLIKPGYAQTEACPPVNRIR